MYKFLSALSVAGCLAAPALAQNQGPGNAGQQPPPPPPAAGPGIASAQDVILAPIGTPPAPGVVPVAAGSTVTFTTPPGTVHTVVASFDPVTGVLLTGNGITITASNITLNLNGNSILSASNVAADGAALGLDVENAGIVVTGSNVKVTNLSGTQSKIENFTTNIDVAGNAFTLQGSVNGAAFNLLSGRSHGGGSLSVRGANGALIRQVKLSDVDPLLGPVPPDAPIGGGVGLELRLTQNVQVRNCSITGQAGGMLLRDSSGALIRNNAIQSQLEDGVEVRNSFGSSIQNNTIQGNPGNGITVRGDSGPISISGNVFGGNAGCDVQVVAGAQQISVNGTVIGLAGACLTGL